jgi:hypothetical protein
MTSQCIHGFSTEQCAQCRPCPHGLPTSGCGRCQAASTSAARRRWAPNLANQPASEDHQGFEIFWVPDVDGWQFRAKDAAPSAESYRSVFLARKAIDRLATQPHAAPNRKQNR